MPGYLANAEISQAKKRTALSRDPRDPCRVWSIQWTSRYDAGPAGVETSTFQGPTQSPSKACHPQGFGRLPSNPRKSPLSGCPGTSQSFRSPGQAGPAGHPTYYPHSTRWKPGLSGRQLNFAWVVWLDFFFHEKVFYLKW